MGAGRGSGAMPGVEKSDRNPAGAGDLRAQWTTLGPPTLVRLRSIHVISDSVTTTSIRPARRADATSRTRSTITPPRVTPIVSRPQVPQIPRAAILRRLHVIKRRTERMPGTQPIPDRPPCPTAQPALRRVHLGHHDRQQARVLRSAQLLGVVRHSTPPYALQGIYPHPQFLQLTAVKRNPRETQ